MSGDESGKEMLTEAIDELTNNSEALKYNMDVWLTGALMKKAEALQDKEALQKAKEIIDSNEELVLRKKQLEKLTSELAS